MIEGFNVRSPMPEEHAMLTPLVKGWLTEAKMIPEDVSALLNDVAVVGFQDERPVAFMATTRRITNESGEITAEIGAMVKDKKCPPGIGVELTQAAVIAEQESGKSDKQIAFATSPQSEATFGRENKCNAPIVDSTSLHGNFFEACRDCRFQPDAKANGRRCCATVFDLTKVPERAFIPLQTVISG